MDNVQRKGRFVIHSLAKMEQSVVGVSHEKARAVPFGLKVKKHALTNFISCVIFVPNEKTWFCAGCVTFCCTSFCPQISTVNTQVDWSKQERQKGTGGYKRTPTQVASTHDFLPCLPFRKELTTQKSHNASYNQRSCFEPAACTSGVLFPIEEGKNTFHMQLHLIFGGSPL